MTAKKIRVCAVFGIIAGLLCSSLGAGGGIALIYLFSILDGNKKGLQKENFASSLAVLIPLSAVSAISYAKAGNISWSLLSVVLIPGAVGGVIGGAITSRIDTSLMRTVFALITILGGTLMIVR